MNVIELSGVRKSFPHSGFLLDLPDLQVREGFVTGFIGENGAGKTTTLKLIMGMITPSEGSATVFRMDAARDSAKIKQWIGYVGDQNGYLEQARLKIQAKMRAPFFDGWDGALFSRYAERFSLDLNKKYKELSKGQQKQFALAMALSHRPRLLLMDEPTANLDPRMRQELLDILADEMQREGMSVFFSTHITSDLDKIADYLHFLHGGKILLSGEKDSLLESHRIVKGRTELFTPEISGLLLGGKKSDFGFSGLTDRFPAIYEALGDEALYEKPTVEDIFLGYTNDERGTL